MEMRSRWFSVTSRHLPFLNDDNDSSQQEDEDHQTSGTHPENQTHLFRVLGDLQGFAVIFTCRLNQEHMCTLTGRMQIWHSKNRLTVKAQ